jgi:hypothetical protein
MLPHDESKSRRKQAKFQGQASRFAEAQRSVAQSGKTVKKYGNKGPNTKANTSDKREMKSMLHQIFTVWNHNAKGKGKGKGCGRGKNGKGGLGKGKGKGN